MSLRTHTEMEGKKMKYEDCKDMLLDLSSIGGNRPYRLEELVGEIICHRRTNFWMNVFSVMEESSSPHSYVFDAIGFMAATKDFYEYLHHDGLEGEVVYDVIAGDNWVWHCKTQITWESARPIAGGILKYHTDVVPNENVNPHRVNALTGTYMQIKVLKNGLKRITFKDALKRDGFTK